MNQWQNKPRREPVQLGIRVQVEALAMAKLWHWVDRPRAKCPAWGWWMKCVMP